MRKQITRLCMATLLLLCATQGSAFDNDDYKAYAQEMRKAVWAQDSLPEFKNYKCPAKYKNESAVVLAAYDEMLLDQKSKLRMSGLNFYTVKQLNYNRLNRQLIYINDQASLKKFSEFDYKTYSKKHFAGLGDDIVRNVLGVRIIKPDGTIKEVSTDDYVTANEGKKDKDKGEKLAVPGLQVGDVIDVFTSEMKQIREENIAPVVFAFINDYPTLSYRIHCSIDPKLTTQYRQLNGAPDFKQSTDAEGNIILDAMMTNIDKSEPDLWYNTAAQTPLTLLYIQGRKITGAYVPESVKDKGLQANPSAEAIQKDDWRFWGSRLLYGLDSNEKKLVKELAKQSISDEEKADIFYNFYNDIDLSLDDINYSPSYFISSFGQLLTKAKIPFQRGITTDDGSEPLDQLISYRNTTWVIRLNNGKIYTPPSGMHAPGYIPASLQGRQVSFNTSVKKPFDGGTYEKSTLPTSTSADNTDKVELKASVEGTLLHISRTEARTGTLKETLSAYLPTHKQIADSYAAAQPLLRTYEDLYTKKARNKAPENAAKDKELQKERFKDEVGGYQGEDAKSVESYDIVSMGHEKINAPFTYRVDYTMDGYVKKAGNNLILAVGKLIGEQLKVEGNARKRTADIYRSAPTTMEWNITVTLPAGYHAAPESLAKLNTQVDNECGSFKATATGKGNTLTLHATKVYKHKTEPVANWNKILQMLDAASDFTSKQVVLKKIGV